MNKEEMRTIGMEMRGMVKKAIKIIQKESHTLIVAEKTAYDRTKEDFVTNGDKETQRMYIRQIRRLFPTFGIIAEEKELRISCTHPEHTIYFTVDPLDGTKAYVRGQSHGVGTMISLVCDGTIVAAYIGDANTGEIYGYTTAEKDGHATRERFGRKYLLQPDVERPLTKQYVSLREAPSTQPPLLQKMYASFKKGGLFKDIEVSGGSIGTGVARLWKGEVGAISMNPHFETPWDLMPVLGVSQRLGFVFLKFDGTLLEYEPALITEVTESTDFQLVVHKKHLAEMQEWLKANR